MYFHLVFFCGYLCQGIFASFSDQDTSLSSESLIRNRRVIGHSPGAQHEPVNYIVKIVLGNQYVCQGAILSHSTVITASRCIFGLARAYDVLSGGAYNGDWNYHNVTSEELYSGNPPVQPIDGIVLLTVRPYFVFTTNTGRIQLHAGPLNQGALINVFGWEAVYPTGPGTRLRYRLRTITLPIMNHAECTNLYRNNHRVFISGKHICTTCAEEFCDRDEFGGPLVVNNRLAGIHTLKTNIPGQLNPDVFVNLQLADYSEWIRRHTRGI